MYRILEAVIFIFLVAACFFLLRYCVKIGLWGKWCYAIFAVLVLLALTPMSIELTNIYLDIKEESYITYEGVYEERSGGRTSLKTVVIYDEYGKEIKLLRTSPRRYWEIGENVGVIVYGKRSRIIVEYDGVPKN